RPSERRRRSSANAERTERNQNNVPSRYTMVATVVDIPVILGARYASTETGLGDQCWRRDARNSRCRCPLSNCCLQQNDRGHPKRSGERQAQGGSHAKSNRSLSRVY